MMADLASTTHVQTFWTIMSESKAAPAFSFDSGKKMVIVAFTSQEQAEQFVTASTMDTADLLYVELDPHPFVEWLRMQIKKGRHFVSLNPADDREAARATPILNLLLTIE
jgi:hypothetical protein